MASINPEELAQLLFRDAAPKPDFRPATAEQLKPLLEAAQQKPFSVGEVVTLREHAKGRVRFPRFGEHVIVTQTFPEVRDTTELSSTRGAIPCDITVGMVASGECNCEDPGCPAKTEHLVEFAHHSRDFIRVDQPIH